ncbi:hypothetical protein [Phenylobacterium sp.]|uniref:hypothetical protein n=1 Tax=Phenylobacterium sp. TaxID=1871053 RepID=UPI0025FCC78B|nr:hypothetical protein [Phenylobacterium sp.]
MSSGDDGNRGLRRAPRGWLEDLLTDVGHFGLRADGRGIRFWELLSLFGFAGGMAAVALYAWPSSMTFGILALVGSAAWLSGGVLGFLFGVPRLRAAAPQAPTAGTSFAPNTNLEQISDWLTKIIVGATLVQLRPLADEVNTLALAIGVQLGTQGGATVAGAVMITYFAGGFLWGYLWCSLRVFKEMVALINREQAVSSREAAAAQSDNP